MHFNTKYISPGDSEKEIKDKVNYNFNQILSFAVGHEGTIGPKGATGIPGPSGKRGNTGSTGNRASDWFRGITFPSSPQEFDLWVNDSSDLGDVYERGPTSWNYTGFSLFSSDFFEVYSGLVGPLGLTNKSGIGLNPSYIPDQTSLVISDSYFSSLDVNPNNSKLLIGTEDQTDYPIFSFNKSNGNSLEYPSFYWKNTGALSDLIFKSPGGLSFISLLDLNFSTNDPFLGGDFNIQGDSFTSITSGDLNLISSFRLSLFSDSTINSVIINSLNFGVDNFNLYTNTLTEISHTSGGYILSSTPSGSSNDKYFGGIFVNSNSTESRVFDFTGISGGSILYGLPLGSVSSGNHKQVVFGETGGVPTGATSGPYSYHVKRLNNITVTPSSAFPSPYANRNSTYISFNPIANVLSISNPSNWNSNMIVVTVKTSMTSDAYITIPSGLNNSSLEPLYYSGEGNEYRVYLNHMAGNRKIKGIIYNYYYKGLISPRGGSPTTGEQTRSVYINFPSSCSYVDLFWAYRGSSTNPNGRIFWKTCNGSGGVLEMTNYYTISGNAAPTTPAPRSR